MQCKFRSLTLSVTDKQPNNGCAVSACGRRTHARQSNWKRALQPMLGTRALLGTWKTRKKGGQRNYSLHHLRKGGIRTTYDPTPEPNLRSMTKMLHPPHHLCLDLDADTTSPHFISRPERSTMHLIVIVPSLGCRIRLIAGFL